MKKIFSLLLAALFFGTLSAQTVVTVNADITTNTTWTNNNIYLLTGGFIYVTNNAELTIEKGTLIKGDAASLVITRGAKIHAVGTAEEPIVFTSHQPAGSRSAGDWGGVLILGKAKINDPVGERTAEGGIDPVKGLYGGNDDNDNSGEFQYCRIEYAGVAYQPNSETNSLTLGGVGKGTQIHHVQVTYGGDDGFEWFGGAVDGKYLVSQATLDDHFDVDYGYRGQNQFLFAISDSLVADISGSHGFECDNDATGTLNTPITKGIFSNVTIVGPRTTPTTQINANHRRAFHLRRSTQVSVFNSVFTSFPTGVKIEGQNTANGVTANDLRLKNNVFTGMGAMLDSSGLSFNMANWFANSGNTTYPNTNDVMYSNPFSYTTPDMSLMMGSPLATGADFTDSYIQNNFFTPVAYRGAFDDKKINWMSCWTEFDAQNAAYNGAIKYIEKPVLTANGPTAVCEGTVVVIDAPAGYASYLWSNGATTQSISVTDAGNYTCTVTNARGCEITSDPVTVAIIPAPVADFTATVNGLTVQLNNTSTGAAAYSWTFGDGQTSNQQNPGSHTYATAGSYTVCLGVVNAQGCIDTTCKAVQAVVSIDMQKYLNTVVVRPNPTSAQALLSFDAKAAMAMNVSVMDMAGKVLSTQNINAVQGENELTIDATQLSEGVYFIQLQTENAIQTLKLNVVK